MALISDVVDKVTRVLEEKKSNFLKSRKPQQISFRQLCSEWLWAKRSEAYTHQIHRYPAKILPYIPIFFLSNPFYSSEEDLVVDPFAGTGTVLLESIIHPYFKRNSVGVEINPLARLIAKVKTTPLNTDELDATAERLLRRIETYSGEVEIPRFTNIDFWFSKKAQVELAKIRNGIQEEVDSQDFRDFFWVSFSSIIREVSFADPAIPPPVLLQKEKFKGNTRRMKKIEKMIDEKKNPNPLLHFRHSIAKNVKRLEKINTIPEVMLKQVKATIIWDDAKDIHWGRLGEKGVLDKSDYKSVESGSVGIVITSPPYISAQKYVRTTKFELLWLGIAQEKDLYELEKKTIGSERVHKKEYKDLLSTGFPQIDAIVEAIYQQNPERAYIVAKYFVDMQTVMKEVYRILRDDGRFIMVIGDNKVCGKVLQNHVFIPQIANQIGFDLEMILVDEIKSRGMITKRHESGGLMLNEWIIVLNKGD
jgi:DNA modification methylase